MTKQIKKTKQVQKSKEYLNMFQAYAAFWRRGFTEWAGTSSRSEYWWTCLVNFLIMIAWGFLFLFFMALSEGLDIPFENTETFFGLIILLMMYGFAVVVPSISLFVRRLHDAGLSAWWLLLWLLNVVPIFGIITGIVFFVFAVLPTKIDGNPYHKFNK